jgi:hypothetical protein
MARQKSSTLTRSIQAGLLSFVLPGAGHYVLGHRGLGIVCFVAITLPYLVGLAFGGIKDSVNVVTNQWLFLAEVPVGGYTVPCHFISRQIEHYIADREARHEPVNAVDYSSYYPESDVAQIYLATAGLLNLLVILDAIARAQTGGLPTFQREMLPQAEPGEHP